MPLRGHFHSPWSDENHWEGFHSAWANTLVRHLNLNLLPKRYRAVPQVHLGTLVEADVAAFEKNGATGVIAPDESSAAAATTAVWAPPQPTQVLAVSFLHQDVVEVRVLDEQRGLRLVGAIEFVSPGNKDRPENRRAFAAKCAGYLLQQVGVIIVDVVTERHGNLHEEILRLLGREEQPGSPGDLYAVAYRAQPNNGTGQLETWPATLSVGQPLPSLPLWLASAWPIPIDLEATYAETCQVLRID